MLQVDLGFPIQNTRCKRSGNVVTLMRKATTSALAPEMESSQMNKAGATYVANQKEVRMGGGIKLTILFLSPQLKATEDEERKTRVEEASNEDLQFHSPNFWLAAHPHQDWDQGYPDAARDEKRKSNTLMIDRKNEKLCIPINLKTLEHFHTHLYPMSQVERSHLTKNFVHRAEWTKEEVQKIGAYVDPRRKPEKEKIKPNTFLVIEEESPIFTTTTQQPTVVATSEDPLQPKPKAKTPQSKETQETTPPTKIANEEENLNPLTTGQRTEEIQEQPKREEEAMRDQLQVVDKEWALAIEEEDPILTTPTQQLFAISTSEKSSQPKLEGKTPMEQRREGSQCERWNKIDHFIPSSQLKDPHTQNQKRRHCN